MKIGVVGVQGAVSEHIDMLRRIEVEGVWIRNGKQLEDIDGLIIPGGESTTISRLMVESGIFNEVREMGKGGFPIYGTCAGLILLAKKGDKQVRSTKQKLLGLMDMEITRNAFGRQRESFEERIDVGEIRDIPCVFIRAPAITRVWGKCKPLGVFQGRIIAARQGNMLATAFHPELTDDTRIHEYFIRIVRGKE